MKIDELANDWQEVSALLDEALALPEEERPAWLERLEGPASRHRVKLSVLLAAAVDVETGDFLDTLPPVDTSTEADASRLRGGDEVGPYTLIVPIGQGGMGAVWLASRTDAKPARKVALKLPYVSWDPRLASRLELERDIVAALEHPNIARLYDAGIDAIGRPWLALEYVEGKPIDLYADDHALDLRQRLELVVQVAAAVAHAHSRLVIHGDLKPPNILVTEQGQVRLLDFGLGRLLDPDATQALTREFGRGLTPAYASPEQARGEPMGTATDVYSLGVVAYELLCGARPAIAGAIDLPSRACSDRRRGRMLRGDLDAVLMRALREPIEERYATIEAFAADIRRHLNGEPVTAQPDAAGYRLRKFIARHRLPVAFGGLAAIALLLGAGVSAWQTQVARLEAQRADEVKRFTLSIIRDADTDSGAGAATTAAQLLTLARRRIEVELVGRPDVQAELMTAIAYGLIGQNEYQDAVPAAEQAVDYATRSQGADSLAVLSAQLVQVEALLDVGEIRRASALVDPLVALAHRLGQPLREVKSLQLQSEIRYALDDTAGSVAAVRAAVDIAQGLTPMSRQDRVDIADAYLGLADAISWSSSAGLADAAQAAIVKIDEVRDPPLVSQALHARGLLGEALISAGSVKQGLAALTDTFEGYRKRYGPDYRQTSIAANRLANARLSAGDAEGSIEAQRVALRGLPSTTDANQRATVMATLASAYVQSGRSDEGLRILTELAAQLEAAGATDLSMYWRVKISQGSAALRAGDIPGAARAMDIGLRAKLSPYDNAIRNLRLSDLRTAQRRHDEAIALARESVATLADYPLVMVRAQGQLRLGGALLAAGRTTEAIEPLEQAKTLYGRAYLYETADSLKAASLLEQARKTADPPTHLNRSTR